MKLKHYTIQILDLSAKFPHTKIPFINRDIVTSQPSKKFHQNSSTFLLIMRTDWQLTYRQTREEGKSMTPRWRT